MGADLYYTTQKVDKSGWTEGQPLLATLYIIRNEKCVTFLGAICTSGPTLKPLIIISRKTVDQELFELVSTPENVDYAYS